MKQVCIHNGSDEQKTLSALRKAASHASGKARSVIQGLAKALSHNPAARGRNEKGAASMAKKRTKRATAKRRTATNPSTPKRSYRRHVKRAYTRRSNPTTLGSRLKGLDLTGILMEGAGVAAGGLASSFASRQAARMAPDMNPVLRTSLATAVVAGGLAYFGRGRGFLRSMAVGAVSGGISNIASSLMPGLFAGVDEEMGAVYTDMSGWDGNGVYQEELGAGEEEMGGVLFDQAAPAPYVRNF